MLQIISSKLLIIILDSMETFGLNFSIRSGMRTNDSNGTVAIVTFT